MLKIFATAVLGVLIVANLSFAQDAPGGVKTYSGHYIVKNKSGFWQSVFSKKSNKPPEVFHDRQCSIEFKSPISFSPQSVAVIPQQLTYSIKFKTDPPVSDDTNEKCVLGKFLIKIYTNDDDEYTIDPEEEGNQIGINDEHHIVDSYLIYLILGQNINHLEVISPSDNDDQGKYILNKLEVHDNQ